LKLSDGKGLYLLVNPVGSKLWRWKYRFLGKEKVMSLGAYPDVSLAQARDGMGAARKLLASGTDPMAQRATDKITKQASAEILSSPWLCCGGTTGTVPRVRGMRMM
jgi:hypothetical protein